MKKGMSSISVNGRKRSHATITERSMPTYPGGHGVRRILSHPVSAKTISSWIRN